MKEEKISSNLNPPTSTLQGRIFDAEPLLLKCFKLEFHKKYQDSSLTKVLNKSKEMFFPEIVKLYANENFLSI